MTKLTKPVKRLSSVIVRDGKYVRPVVITIKPPGTLYFRLKGCRRSYALDVATCYTMAVRAHVLDQKKAKAKSKAKKRTN
jgi:hypothetical protein